MLTSQASQETQQSELEEDVGAKMATEVEGKSGKREEEEGQEAGEGGKGRGKLVSDTFLVARGSRAFLVRAPLHPMQQELVSGSRLSRNGSKRLPRNTFIRACLGSFFAISFIESEERSIEKIVALLLTLTLNVKHRPRARPTAYFHTGDESLRTTNVAVKTVPTRD